MARRKLTSKEVEDLFLDIWYKLTPEVFDGVFDSYNHKPLGEEMINDCAILYPILYKKVMDMIDDQANKEGFSY